MTFVYSPNNIPNVYPPLFDPETQGNEIRDYLRNEGYVVVQVTSAQEAQTIYQQFWDYLESLGTNISRNDPSSWDKDRTWPYQRHGMITSYGIGQAEFTWKARIKPKVLKTFAKIWDVPETKLLTSFDGANMYPNPRYAHNANGEGQEQETADDTINIRAIHQTNPTDEGREVSVKIPIPDQAPILPDSIKTVPDKLGLVHTRGTYELWPHRDQSATDQDFKYVQGQYTLLPNTSPDDGGVIVYPRTHTIDWTQRCDRAKKGADFFRIPHDAPEVDPSKAAVLRTPAGCLVLWDSRLAHCNRPPTARGRTRAVTYICMLPRGKASSYDLAERQTGHRTFQTSIHWPYPYVRNYDGDVNSPVSHEQVMKKLKKKKAYGTDDPVIRGLVGYTEASIMSFMKRAN
ncbi:hypothetical protein BGZ76_004291 [Entomortierella beljakovae]|nr:hypothetical protein BGZ76_004291 [Entomortierella beljakovae]